MEITTYNDHLKAPFFPVVFVVKQRILCRTGPSLLSNQSFAPHEPAKPSGMKADAKGGFQKRWINNPAVPSFASNSIHFALLSGANRVSIRCNSP